MRIGGCFVIPEKICMSSAYSCVTVLRGCVEKGFRSSVTDPQLMGEIVPACAEKEDAGKAPKTLRLNTYPKKVCGSTVYVLI